jgi:hypothetical protein
VLDLNAVFTELDNWIQEYNRDARGLGGLELRGCEFKIVGQLGLLQGGLTIELNRTFDMDAYTDAVNAVREKLDAILKTRDFTWDPLGSEVWMPEETAYTTIFTGIFVTVYVAGPEYILISKALKAPDKNRELLEEYLTDKPTELFLGLAKKYNVDLLKFLK